MAAAVEVGGVHFLIRSVTTNNPQPQWQLGQSDLSFTRGGLNNKFNNYIQHQLKRIIN
jgi:hypothetical protein